MWTSKEVYKLKQNAVQTLTSGTSTASTASITAKLYNGNKIVVTGAISVSGDNVNFILPFNAKFIDAYAIGTAAGSAGGEIEICNDNDQIFDDFDCNTASALTRATTIDTGVWELTSGTSCKIKSISDDLAFIAVIDIMPV